MDNKKSPIRRAKRSAKVLEDNFWDCSVCTFRNTAEAFKCLMCDVRKGTSTRKPRINPQLVAQQVASQYLPATSNQKREKKDKKSMKKRRHPPRLKNVDRSSAQTREVTVNSVTVVITEYKPKMKSAETISSSSSSDHGSQSESSMDARWILTVQGQKGEFGLSGVSSEVVYRVFVAHSRMHTCSVSDSRDNDLWRQVCIRRLFISFFKLPHRCTYIVSTTTTNEN